MCRTVVAVGILVQLCKVQVMIEGEEQRAVRVFCVSDGINWSHVGFIQSHLNKDINTYTGALGDVLEVYNNSSTSAMKCCKYNEHFGFMIAKIFHDSNCIPTEPYHPTSIVVDIVGTSASYQGYSC